MKGSLPASWASPIAHSSPFTTPGFDILAEPKSDMTARFFYNRAREVAIPTKVRRDTIVVGKPQHVCHLCR